MISYEDVLPDRRLVRRAYQLGYALSTLRTVSIAQLASDWAEQMAFYRFLNNPRVRLCDLQAALTSACVGALPDLPSVKESTEEQHLLLIQDTTELNFQAHAGRHEPDSGLGVISDGESLGFHLHPTLALEADTGFALGFADVRCWARPREGPDKHERGYQRLPIEEKESYRWIEATQAAHQRLNGQALTTTIVADREADICDLFARLPLGVEAVIRARHDRRIEEPPNKLVAFLDRQPVSGTRTVRLRGDLRRGRQGRLARLAYRFGAVSLLRPHTCLDEAAPKRLPLFALQIKEIAVPAGQKPVCWHLLSTHPIEAFEDAAQVGDWYRQRWHLEQVFRLLKADGLDLEASELATGTALMRLGVMALGAALDVMRLMMAERGASQQPLEHVFEAEKHPCLHELAGKLEGRTQKQQNPHPVGTMAWGAWLIARLGGWNGYRSQHRAGPATYHEGLRRFALIYDGWHLFDQDLYKR